MCKIYKTKVPSTEPYTYEGKARILKLLDLNLRVFRKFKYNCPAFANFGNRWAKTHISTINILFRSFCRKFDVTHVYR